jgi:hypothetical protein
VYYVLSLQSPPLVDVDRDANGLVCDQEWRLPICQLLAMWWRQIPKFEAERAEEIARLIKDSITFTFWIACQERFDPASPW